MITRITQVVNWTILISFFACFSYQALYLLAVHHKKGKPHLPEKMHRFAILIAARNEEGVIGQLIESIRRQDYPQELLDIYVVSAARRKKPRPRSIRSFPRSRCSRP